MSSISPNVTHKPLLYHEVSAARLPSVTSIGLQAAGIPIEALGLRNGSKQILTSCFTFSSFARESMPPSLGGLDESAEARLGPVSVQFLTGVTGSSPARRTSPNGSPYKPKAPSPTPAVRPAVAPKGPESLVILPRHSARLGPRAPDKPHLSLEDPQEGMKEHKPKSAKASRREKKEEDAAVAAASSGDLGESVGSSTSTTVASGEEGFDPSGTLESGEAGKTLPVVSDSSFAKPLRTEIDRPSGLLDSDGEEDVQALHEAMAGLHMHGSPARSLSSSEGGRFAPKDLEVHIQAARANDAARAKAFATLSAGEVRFALIGEALRRKCGVTEPAVMADFSSVALEEAATGFNHQLSGLLILLTSARVHSGSRCNLATSYLGDRFDERGADHIDDGDFTLELDPVQLALGCYPVLQIALHIFYANHVPIEAPSAPMVEAAKAVKLMKGSAFSPARGLDAFFIVHAQARRDKLDYDASAVYNHLIQAIYAASGVSYEYFPPNGDPPVSWRSWAMRITREHRDKVAKGGLAAGYVPADVDTLRNGLRRFADAFDREQGERELGASFGAAHLVEVPSHATFDLDAAVQHGVVISSSCSTGNGHGDSLASSVNSRAVAAVGEGEADKPHLLFSGQVSVGGAVAPLPIGPAAGAFASAPVGMGPVLVGGAVALPLVVSAERAVAPPPVGALAGRWLYVAHDDDGPSIPLYPPPLKKGKGKGKGTSKGKGRTSTGFGGKGRGGRDGGKGKGKGRPAALPDTGGGSALSTLQGSEGLPVPVALVDGGGTVAPAPVISDVLCTWSAPTQPSSAFGEEPVHVSVPCTLCDTASDLLSLNSMVEAGWSFTWTPQGHFLTVPGVKAFPLISQAHSTLAYLEVVLVPGTEDDPKVTFYDHADLSHHGRKKFSFLVDTGADHSLLKPDCAPLLARSGSFPGVRCTGIAGGVTLPVLGSGYLDFVFPGYDTRSFSWAGGVVGQFAGTPPKTMAIHLVTRDIHRPSAGPLIMSAKQAADRFNIFDHDALLSFHDTIGIRGAAPFKVDRRADYSAGIAQRAMGRRAPTRQALNQITMEIRESIPPGHAWWTDISHKHVPDFAGNVYRRIFAEQRTGRVCITFSKRKDTLSLLRDLESMHAWVKANVPGGEFRFLGCDFGSEYAQQGHGDRILVDALRQWQVLHPGFRCIPLAAYDQAHNLAESATHQLAGLAYTNACRAHLGPTAWSLMDIGAAYQLNHKPARRGNDLTLRDRTRDNALTGREADVSLMLGYVGQLGWTHDQAGKANVFRPCARAGVYVCPAEEARAQLFFDLDSNKLMAVRAVTMGHDPNTVPFSLATSDMYRPMGSHGMPDMSAYTTRLRSMLLPGVNPESVMVAHDPLSGEPACLYEWVPHLDEDGGIVLQPEVQRAPHPSSAAGDECPGLVDASDSESDEGEGDVPARPAMARRKGQGTPGGVPAGQHLDAASVATSALSQLLRDSVKPIAGLVGSTRLVYDGDAKAPKPGKAPSLSRTRYVTYAVALTLDEYFAVHPGSAAEARQDLRFDATRGHVVAPDLPHPVVHVVLQQPRHVHLRRSWRDHPDPSGDSWVAAYESRLTIHREDMAALAAQQLEADRINGLEERPPAPFVEPDLNAPAGIQMDPRRYAPAYVHVEARSRAAVLVDYGDDALGDEDVPAFGEDFDITPAAVIFAGADPTPPGQADFVVGATSFVGTVTGCGVAGSRPPTGGPVGVDPRTIPPLNVREAMARPDFAEPFGWKGAMDKEVARVKLHKAWRLVPIGHMRAARRRYGDSRVNCGYVVSVLSCKTDPSGDPRGGGITNKFRVAVAESKGTVLAAAQTYSSCADDISNRVITAIGPTLEAHQTSIDVGGAYYFGKPPTMDEADGRMFYCAIPFWLESYGYPAYGPDGERNMLLIEGNMPGRADAGRIWQSRFNGFLKAYGLRQLVTDRRVWVMHSTRGILIIHDHVDDSRLTSTTVEARSHFYLAWAAEFNSPPESAELSENFTGLKHEVLSSTVTRISCGAVVRNLVDLVAPFLPHFSPMVPATPLPADALKSLRSPPAHQAALCPNLLPHAQKIAGTIGFVVNSVRPDGYFAYCVLAGYCNALMLNEFVFRILIRLARYLTNTAELSLTLHAEPPSKGGPVGLDLVRGFVDSSHGNAPEGRSYGGFVLMCKGGGALAWKCAAPTAGDDSTGAAELRMGTLALKYIVALRTLQRDLDVGVAPRFPTPLFTDAQALIDGTGCERLSKSSRWMASRYAMIRWGLACGSIDLAKVPAADNCADIVTKCLVGEAFFRHRATILGLAQA